MYLGRLARRREKRDTSARCLPHTEVSTWKGAMLIHKAFKYRLYPNNKQRRAIENQFGACRFVWNYFLEYRQKHYAETGKILSYFDTAKLLTVLKQQPEYGWMNEVQRTALVQKLMDLQAAYTNFFEKRGRFPKFKSKRDRQSCRFPADFRVEGDNIRVPKVGMVTAVIHRPFDGKPKSMTVSRTSSGKYYASIMCEIEMDEPAPNVGPQVGIDLGLTHFAITSDGTKYANPRYYVKAQRKLRRLQRTLSRRVKDSAGRNKARIAVARHSEHVANMRSHHHHELSSKIIRESQAVYIEDLNVSGLMKNRKLAKHINDAAWGEFVRQLEYKGKWYGCAVVKVGRFAPSSKTCSVCGAIKYDLALKDRSWTCRVCSTTHDRDINAALNILKWGCEAHTAKTAESNADGEHVRPSRVSARVRQRSLKSEVSSS